MCIHTASRTLSGEQTSPPNLGQEFPHTASLVPSPLPQPHTLLASPHGPQTPQVSGQNSSHNCTHCKQKQEHLGSWGWRDSPGAWPRESKGV